MKPVSIIVALILIITYFLPEIGLVGTVNCFEKTIKQYITNSFHHANVMHLLANLISLFQLSVLEERYGTIKFTIILLALLILSNIIHYFMPDQSCTIGFSAVLIGLIIFDKFLNNGWLIDITMIQSIVLLLLLPYFGNRKISFFGHLSGVLAGLLLGYTFKFFGIDP